MWWLSKFSFIGWSIHGPTRQRSRQDAKWQDYRKRGDSDGVTVCGRDCRKWLLQTLQKHDYVNLGDHNFDRNPKGWHNTLRSAVIPPIWGLPRSRVTLYQTSHQTITSHFRDPALPLWWGVTKKQTTGFWRQRINYVVNTGPYLTKLSPHCLCYLSNKMII